MMDDNTRRGGRGGNKYATACSIIASVISILLGYDTGVMSGANLFIKDDLGVSDTQIQVLNGILNLCALVGAATGGRTSDLIGRRSTIALSSAIFFSGAVLMGLAPSFPFLLTGRCVAGVGVGFALLIAPVYAAEISSPSSRGSLTSLPEVCISFGILLGYVSNYVLSKLPLSYTWRTMLGLAALPSLMLFFGVFAMPESPRWLAMQGRMEEAKEVLLKVSDSKEEVDTRLQEIQAALGDVTAERSRGGAGVWKELLLRPSPAVRRILLAVVGIHIFEHATGIEAVVLYSPRIFQKAGIATKNKLLLATMGVGLTKTLFILVATAFLDRLGRRPLLLASVAGIALSLAGLGSALTVEERGGGAAWVVGVAITCVLSYVACFSVGLGPITWVYSSEVFPLRLRAQGASLGVAVNRVMNATVSMTFVSLYKAVTIGGAFFLFAGLAVVAWAFFYSCLPETKGRSLEEMEEEVFGGGGGRKEATRKMDVNDALLLH